MQVLAIDDDAAVLRAIKRMLEPAFQVSLVASATEAMEKFGAGARYDLILCDLMMPEVTGIEFHDRLLRQFPSLAERIIFLTGGAFTPDAKEFFEKMRSRVLEKPIAPAQLREAVTQAIRSQQSLEN